MQKLLNQMTSLIFFKCLLIKENVLIYKGPVLFQIKDLIGLWLVCFFIWAHSIAIFLLLMQNTEEQPFCFHLQKAATFFLTHPHSAHFIYRDFMNTCILWAIKLTYRASFESDVQYFFGVRHKEGGELIPQPDCKSWQRMWMLEDTVVRSPSCSPASAVVKDSPHSVEVNEQRRQALCAWRGQMCCLPTHKVCTAFSFWEETD